MKTAVSQTSFVAYAQEIEPKLGERQQRVYHLLKHSMGDMTNTEISQALGWPINTVTPRCNELRKMKVVELAQQRTCRVTGRMAKAWRITRIQNSLFD